MEHEKLISSLQELRDCMLNETVKMSKYMKDMSKSIKNLEKSVKRMTDGLKKYIEENKEQV